MIHVEQLAERIFPLDDLPASSRGTPPRAAYLAAMHERLCWVAESEADGIIGFIACARMDAFLHILEIDVLPDFGRQGVGRALLAQACTAAAAMEDVHGVTLTTFRHLPWNQPFYEKHGFEPVPDGSGIHHLVTILCDEEQAGLRNRVAMVKKAPARERQKTRTGNILQ